MYCSRFGRFALFLIACSIFLARTTTFAWAEPQYPTILIHGIGSNGDMWDSAVSYLHAKGLRFGGHIHYEESDFSKSLMVEEDIRSIGDLSNAVYTVTFSDYARTTNNPFHSEAIELSQMIALVRSSVYSDCSKVNLIGHSMGGLVARAYVQDPMIYGTRNDVNMLLTIGTPHLGSYLADLFLGACFVEPKVQEIAVLHPFESRLQRLNIPASPFGHLPDDVFYGCIVARDSQHDGLGAFGLFLPGHDDTLEYLDRTSLRRGGDEVVNVRSQNLNHSIVGRHFSTIDSTHSIPLLIIDNQTRGCYPLCLRHLGEADDPAIQEQVWNLLDGIGRFSSDDCIWHPNGTIIQGAELDCYLLQDDQKRWIPSTQIFTERGFDPRLVVHVTEREIDAYNSGSNLSSFDPNDGEHLVKSVDSSQVFLLDDNATVRWIKNEAVFNARGYRWDRIKTVSNTTLRNYKIGGLITSVYNDGTLLKTPSDPAIWIVSDGHRTAYQNSTAFEKSGYDCDTWNGQDWISVSTDDLDNIPISPEPYDRITESDVVNGRTPAFITWGNWGYPNGGETFQPGDQIPLLFDVPNPNAVRVEVQFTSDHWEGGITVLNNAVKEKQTDSYETKNGSLLWTVPDLVSDNCGFSLTAYDSQGNLVSFDVSDEYFAIAGGGNPNLLPAPVMNSISVPVGQRDYTVSWSSVAEAESYKLQEDTSLAFSSPSNIFTGGTSRFVEYKPTGAYYYRVAAVKNGVPGHWSNIQTAVVQDRAWPGPLSPVSPNDDASGQNLNLTLQWDCTHPAGEAMTYDVILAKGHSDGGDGYYPSQKVSTGQNSKMYSISNLQYDQEYSWKINVRDETGDEKLGPWWHFWTRADSIAPTGSVMINGGDSSTDSYFVTLSLSASDADSGVAGFRVSNDGTRWKTYTGMQQSITWNLADTGYGGQYGLTSYTVYVQYCDVEENYSPSYSDSIAKSASSPGMVLLNGEAYATIQDALDAANSGDTVLLTAGEWNINAGIPSSLPTGTNVNLIIPEGVSLVGAGIGKTVIVGSYGFAVVFAEGNAAVKGLTVVQSYVTSYQKFAVLIYGSNVVVDSCDMTSTNSGIGLIGSWSNVIVERSTIHSCGSYGFYGLEMQVGSSIVLKNCTIDACLYGLKTSWGQVNVTNSIVSNNSSYGVWGHSSGPTPSVSHCDVWGNGTNYQTIPDQTSTNGNISSNPQFVGSGDYSLQSGSPCRDAGTSVGLPANGTPDIGAYEYGALGTVAVNPNIPEAAFTVHGPGGSYPSTKTSWPQANLPAGVYSLSFANVDGYYSPRYDARILGHGETISFDATYVYDNIAPEGQVSVQYGIYATAFPRVDVTLDVEDMVAGMGSGAQMQFSNDGAAWSDPEPFSSLKRNWDLVSYGGYVSSGTKTVYVKISDAFGNWTDPPLTDTILYVPERRILVVPDDHSTIGDALAAAVPGDMVHVEPGVYTEGSDVPYGVRLQGSGPEQTRLNSSSGYRTLNNNSMIDGFKTALLRIVNANAVVSNNGFTGPGIVVVSGSVATIRNNLFVGTSSDAVSLGYGTQTSGQIVNNTFVDIDGYNDSGIRLEDMSVDAQLTDIQNNIIVHNDIGIIDGNFDREHTLFATAYNCYWQNISSNAGGYATGDELFGPGCFEADPLLEDRPNGDFGLQSGSPCIDSGNPDAMYGDVDGTCNDRGYTGGPCANSCPVAILSVTPTLAVVEEPVVLDASLSSDRESPTNEMYARWDFDNDGVFDTAYSLTKAVTRTFTVLGTHVICLETMDRGGFVDKATGTIQVVGHSPGEPVAVSPSNGVAEQPISVTLEWACSDPDPNDTLTYALYFGTTSNPSLAEEGLTSHQKAMGALDYFRYYFWRVEATDSYGLTTSSPVWSFVTMPEPIPATPECLVAQTLGWATVELDWTDVSDNEIGFKIERKSPSDSDFRQIAITSQSEYIDSSLSGTVTYSYRVRAFNASGNGPYSNTAEATTSEEPTPTPTNTPTNTPTPTPTLIPTYTPDPFAPLHPGDDIASPAWEFNRDGDPEGWFGNGQVSGFVVTSGELAFNCTGNDPQLYSVGGLDISADYKTVIEIRMKTTAGNSGVIFFRSPTDSAFTAAKKVPFALVNGEFVTYRIDMCGAAGWTGIIDRLRFDPTNNSGSQVDIDYIRVCLPIFEKAPAWEFNVNSKLDGWICNSHLSEVTVLDGKLSAKVSELYPNIYSPAGISVNAADYRYIETEMRLTGGDAFRIWFRRQGDSYFTVDQSKDVQVFNNTEFGKYLVDMSTVPTYTGVIDQIRINTGSAIGADVDIDAIRFCMPLYEINPIWDFETDGDAEGWRAAYHLTQPVVASGVLSVTSTGIDPRLISPYTPMDSRLCRILIAAMDISKGNFFDVFFSHMGVPGFAGRKRVGIPSNDGRIVYAVDLGTCPNYSDYDVNLLRIDPTNQSGADVQVDSFGMLNSVRVATTSFEFNNNGDLEGWRANDQISPPVVLNGSLRAVSRNVDPILISPQGLSINGDLEDKIVLRMKSSVGNMAYLFYRRSTDPGFASSRRIAFKVYNHSEPVTYCLDMSRTPEWTGIISGLRLDPTSTSGSDIELDYLRVYGAEVK